MNNTNDKNLIEKSNNTIWDKIKVFFYKLFKNNKHNTNILATSEIDENKEKNADLSPSFNDLLKVEETEESKLLQLQTLYRNGKIKEEDLTKEEIKKLCDLYDRQIEYMEHKNKKEMEELIKLKNEN